MSRLAWSPSLILVSTPDPDQQRANALDPCRGRSSGLEPGPATPVIAPVDAPALDGQRCPKDVSCGGLVAPLEDEGRSKDEGVKEGARDQVAHPFIESGDASH
jgi:hypothetical protein